ncbi:cytochrome b [Undibacterium sp. Jales W-56]|uniref:cytochrome b n=1 Tax=Undibacterium sp. Jales W-56 TaxID=2897325 RepID=UPI0021D0F41C|nr:cytochrome b [Undibacterium sp. Jales W-56]MCU6432445.1 cytochrome b [Undibacterium sp. Jales W-56]
MPTPQRYPLTSIVFHWLIALLIVAAFTLGTIMTDMKISPTKLQYYSWHKWLGVTVLGLVALRLLSRLLSQAPAYPDSMPRWQKKAAALTHGALYLLMFAVPLSGYFYTSAAGYPVVYLGLVQLPTIIGPSPELKPVLKELHELLTNVLLALVILHVVAALKHHFIDKDGLLQRMLPGR